MTPSPFHITKYTPTAYSVDVIFPTGQTETICGTHENQLAVLTDIRLQLAIFLYGSTCDIASNTSNAVVKASAISWLEWIQPHISTPHPKVNFRVMMDQWIKCSQHLMKDTAFKVWIESMYNIVMKFLLNWQDPDLNPVSAMVTVGQAA